MSVVMPAYRVTGYIRAGMFDERVMGAEDFDLWIRILHIGGKIRYQRRVLVHYRRRPESLSADPVRMHQQILRVLEYADERNDLSITESRAVQVQIARFRALLCLFEGKRDLFSGDAEAAIAKLRKANAFLRSPKISVIMMFLCSAPELLLRVYNLRDRFLAAVARRPSSGLYE